MEKERMEKEKKDKEELDKKEKERKEKERLELEQEQEEKARIEEEKRKEQIEYGRKIELENARLELERLEKERLENISITIVDPDPVKVEPKPTHIPVGSAIHTNLSIKDGIQILEQLKTQSNSYTILDTINKILYDYLNNCPAATLDKIFKYIPNDNTRIEMLLEQITLKYPLLFEQSKPMLGGAELYRLINS